VETSQRIVDVLLGALAPACPELIPAGSCGSMNNVAIGNDQFAYYETIGGGMGGSPRHRGASAIHSHMTNTFNTPVEALEYSYPFLVTRYKIRKNSGGRGKFLGGDGIVREIKLLSDAQVTVLSERRRIPPYGLHGGKTGKVGQNMVVADRKVKKMPGKFSCFLKKGDTLTVKTPGGGGWGEI